MKRSFEVEDRALIAAAPEMFEALLEIAADDELFIVNPDAFGTHAYRRCVSIASAVIAKLEKGVKR